MLTGIGAALPSQSLTPERIMLNLPRFSAREGVAHEMPSCLDGSTAIRIRRCGGLGPETMVTVRKESTWALC
ncbi:hypothetical protein [Aestuariivirga sp.]|uniref:hypothetical protein n=1 Tax=Aestuariivirga sp. TaxID=2650926 RepID=UPI0025B9A23B|nr:hypothetical protein [Aestuariivirga sp.]MCA3554391.1 hypothetical protein [Aestuariivirga sp.]